MKDEELEKYILKELLEMADEREKELEQWAQEHPEEDAKLQQSGEKCWKEIVKLIDQKRI